MIPRVKEYKELGGCFFREVTLPKTEDGEAAARLLSLFLPSLSVVTGDAPTALLAKDALPVGAYRLAVAKEVYGNGNLRIFAWSK